MSDQPGGIVPPHSIDAEQAILGAMLTSPDIIPDITTQLSVGDFYTRAHRLIFQSITDLSAAGTPIDGITVGDHIDTNGLDEQTGGSAYLAELASSPASPSNWIAYARIVRDRAIRRRVIQVATEAANNALDTSIASDDVYAQTLASIADVGAGISDADIPILSFFDEPTSPPLNREWLPPAIADYVFDKSSVLGSDPAIMGLSCIVACSAAAHDGIKVCPSPGEPRWRESPRVWGMIVGDPSSKKSPSMKPALRPLEDINFDQATRFNQAFANYQHEMAEFNALDKAATRAKAKGNDAPDLGPRPQKPVNTRTIINDATIEKVADILSDNDRGILYFNDELSGWFASMDAYSKGGAAGRDRSYWLKFYEGGRHIIDRMSREPTMVKNASVSILGSIQPERIRTLATRMDDDGLLQRFMVAIIPTRVRNGSGKPETPGLAEQYEDLIQRIYRMQAPPDGSIVQMSPEALAVQSALIRETTTLVGTSMLPGMLRSHLSKWEGLFPRLCLVYHIIGCAKGEFYPTSRPITGATANRVAAFMRGFLLPSAMRFYTSLVQASSPSYALAGDLARGILANKLTRLGKTEASNCSHAWRNAPEHVQKHAIQILVSGGWLLSTGEADGKRSTPAVNPRAHIEFAAYQQRIRYERRIVAALSNASNAHVVDEFRDEDGNIVEPAPPPGYATRSLPA